MISMNHDKTSPFLFTQVLYNLADLKSQLDAEQSTNVKDQPQSTDVVRVKEVSIAMEESVSDEDSQLLGPTPGNEDFYYNKGYFSRLS